MGENYFLFLHLPREKNYLFIIKKKKWIPAITFYFQKNLKIRKNSAEWTKIHPGGNFPESGKAIGKKEFFLLCKFCTVCSIIFLYPPSLPLHLWASLSIPAFRPSGNRKCFLGTRRRSSVKSAPYFFLFLPWRKSREERLSSTPRTVIRIYKNIEYFKEAFICARRFSESCRLPSIKKKKKKVDRRKK